MRVDRLVALQPVRALTALPENKKRSDAFVQCDSGTFPPLASSLHPGSEHTTGSGGQTPVRVRETVIGLRPQVHL
ncbi:hypothetical protein ABVT39_001968 [Epinephelus coioides]